MLEAIHSSTSPAGGPASLADELALLDHPKIMVGEAKSPVEGGPTKVELRTTATGGRGFRLELLAAAGYPAEPVIVSFEELDRGTFSSQEEKIRLQIWKEQMDELSKDASLRGRGCVEALCDLLVAASEDLVELAAAECEGCWAMPSLASEGIDGNGIDGIDLCHDSDSETPTPVRYLHLVPLTHLHGFSYPLEDFREAQALGRMPSCKMWLDHPSCSGHQLELRAERAERGSAAELLHARCLSKPMLLGSAWLEPGEQRTLRSGDILAIRVSQLTANVPLMVWRLQVTDSSSAPTCSGARLIPLHRPEDFQLVDRVCLGPPPSFQLWTPQLATTEGACAVIERQAGEHILRRPLCGELPIWANYQKLMPGSQAKLAHGTLICISSASTMCGNFQRCTFLVFQDSSGPLPRLIASPCRTAVASPNAVTMTVSETLVAPSQPWGLTRQVPMEQMERQGESAVSVDVDCEKTGHGASAVCRPGSNLWADAEPCAEVSKDIERCSQELVADGETTETTGVASQDVLGDLAGGSLESATDWEAPDSLHSMGRMDHWEQRALEAVRSSQDTSSLKRSCPVDAEADAESTRRRFRPS